MPLPSDQLPPDANYLMTRLATLEREVRELRAARAAEATTIGRDGLTIDGGFLRMLFAAVEIVFVGRDGADRPIFRLRWPSGQDMFFTYLIANVNEWYFAWCDPAGNILFSSDAVSGQGLARPYIPIPSHPRDDQYGFYSTTTSGSFTTVHEVRWIKQHPKVNLVMSTKSSDGASTGDWQVLQSGVVLASGSVAASGTGVSTRFDVAGSHMAPLNLDIQVKRNSGAGSIGALIKSITGEQS